MLLGATGASASQRTVTLAVDGMTCASCPYIVRTALLKLPGVERAVVSYADKTAVVTFDDTQAGIADLTAATAASGFPSRLLDQQQAKPR
jgi:mercuric ion binding protein